jgi:hypothetical protein
MPLDPLAAVRARRSAPPNFNHLPTALTLESHTKSIRLTLKHDILRTSNWTT